LASSADKAGEQFVVVGVIDAQMGLCLGQRHRFGDRVYGADKRHASAFVEKEKKRLRRGGNTGAAINSRPAQKGTGEALRQCRTSGA
jgi:hypothetical protein